MRVVSSSFVIAAMAFSPALGAPTPTMPFDSPVPNSPRLDDRDWAEALRSPQIPRSPMVPAVRIAGRRRSIPHFRRQEEGAPPAEDADTASATGLLGGLGDTLSGILHSVGDIAGTLPIVGGLGILSTDGSDPGSPPPQKRGDDADTASAEGLLGGLGDTLSGVLHQVGDVANSLPIIGDIGLLSTDGSSPPPQRRDDGDADTASAEGLLGGLGDTLSGILHQVGDVANGLPIIGGLGILSADGSSPPPQRRDDGDANTASAEGLLGGLGDTLSGILHQVGDVANGLPIIGGLGILSADGSDPNAPPPQKRDGPPMSTDQLNALRQQVTALLLQQQQVDQVAAVLSATSAGLPVNANDLQQRLLALQNPAQGVVGGINLQGLVRGLPIAGPLVSNTVASVGGLAGGPPVVGGLLGANGLVGGILGGGQGGLGDLTGAATGLLGSVAGVAGGNGGILQNVLGGGGSPTSQPFASANQMHWPDATGFYPHGMTGGAPTVPPNSPASFPSPIVYSPFSMDGTNLTPPVPPPSPASSVASVPMDHDTASRFFASPTDVTSFMPAPSSAPGSVLDRVLGRRRVDGDDAGETPSPPQPDGDADGFSPSMPDADYTPPLLVAPKRSEAPAAPADDSAVPDDDPAVPADDMDEGGPDALSGTKMAPQKLKMFRRLIRGASVSF